MFYLWYKFCLWLLKVEVFVVVDSQRVDFNKSVGIIVNVSVCFWTECHKGESFVDIVWYLCFMESEGVWYFITLGIFFFSFTESNEFGQFAQHTRKQGTAKSKHCAWLYVSAVFYKLNKKNITTVEFYLALVPPFTASFFFFVNWTVLACFERLCEKRCIEE